MHQSAVTTDNKRNNTKITLCIKIQQESFIANNSIRAVKIHHVDVQT